MDCLDRTNVVQSMLARRSLQSQLQVNTIQTYVRMYVSPVFSVFIVECTHLLYNSLVLHISHIYTCIGVPLLTHAMCTYVCNLFILCVHVCTYMLVI